MLIVLAGSAHGVDARQNVGVPHALFATSQECIACHSNLTAPSGEDISIGYSWRASMMANSARDPYWHAGVRRETMDHPLAQAAIEDKCATCHMPMARFTTAESGGTAQVFAAIGEPLSMDGVSCTVCHQMKPDNLGEPESFDGGFLVDKTTPQGQRRIYGPHDIAAGHQQIMRSASRFVPAQTEHLKRSELCATCHTLYTQTLGPEGRVVGELAEQMPYLEWLHSDYRATLSCQDCHMPPLDQNTPISSVLGIPRPEFSQHTFRAANAFMLRILNRYRDDLDVIALPQELDAAAQRAVDFLGSRSALISIEQAAISGDTLSFGVKVQNLAGHKLPTAYPSRRAWLHVTVRNAEGKVLFESGALRPDGSIVGNDNDESGARFEPHYLEISRPEQVQIYEPVLVDTESRVTTGLLTGVRYIKDNRLLPDGFEKASAGAEVAVYGSAGQDPDFVAGGDRVRYRIALPNPRQAVEIAAELNYQTVGFRWAENLKAYDAVETRRFTRYYTETAAFSAMHLAAATVTLMP